MGVGSISGDQFKDHLLSIGGDRVVGMEHDPDLEGVIRHGTLEDSPAQSCSGNPSQCHSNVARMAADDDWIEPRTGYALSDDGIWRSHSWGYDFGEGTIMETTTPRTHYYGFAPDRGAFISENL